MKVRKLSLSVVLIVFLFLISVFRADAAQSFNGKWNTKWGIMEIAVSGNKVTGTYTRKKGKINGVLSGNGKIMTGTWCEAPSYKVPNDAGRFEVKLSEDGNSFKGKWGYGKASKGGELSATRFVEKPAPVTFEGKWHTEWGVMVVCIKGDYVCATYDRNTGKIVGTLSSDGMAIVGKWSKAPSYEGPDDSGKIELRMAADGKSFHAKWGYGTNLGAGSWNGKKE